jgi:hypothetical protein
MMELIFLLISIRVGVVLADGLLSVLRDISELFNFFSFYSFSFFRLT